MSDSLPTPESAYSEVDRREQFAGGPPKLPRKVIWIALGVLAVLGLGGALADKSFNVPPVSPSTTVAHYKSTSTHSLAQFLNLRVLGGRKAPAIDLVDQRGAPFSLGSVAGRPVVLTFLDPRCADICPVEISELRHAAQSLGGIARSIVFVVVNADPAARAVAALRSAIVNDGLDRLPDAYFLTGPLSALVKVWAAYGVTVEYQPTSGHLAHTNLIDILSPRGRLEYSLEPFGNESFTHTYSLPSSEIDRFAMGIAEYVRRVAA